MRIRIVKNYAEFTKGESVDVEPELADTLIKLKVARIDKMMTREDGHTT